jgi:hypothetical protein
MLINIVREIVAPTFLYHSTVKSENLPANIGNISGNWTSDILALTKSITRPYILLIIEHTVLIN